MQIPKKDSSFWKFRKRKKTKISKIDKIFNYEGILFKNVYKKNIVKSLNVYLILDTQEKMLKTF